MRKFYQLFVLAAMLVLPCAVGAQNTLTVADGTQTNEAIPIYGYNIDATQHNQVIYTEEMLDEMVGGTITGMTFYMSSQNTRGAWGTTVTLSLGTATSASLSSLDQASTTQVWQGTWDGTSAEIAVVFDDEFIYEGGNLLLDIQSTAAEWGSASFYGISQDGGSICTYEGYYSTSTSAQDFVPKTTFEYVPGGGQICYRPKNLTITDITNEGATLNWDEPNEVGANYLVFVDGELVDSPSSTECTLSGLEPNTTYTVQVRNFCSVGDTSGALSTTFKTDCANGSCELTVNIDGYYYYNPTIAVYQGGESLVATNDNATVEICSGDSVVVIYQSAPSYSSGSQNVSIIDVAGSELFSGDVSSHSEGDTIIALANGCPTCLPVSGLHATDTSATGFTIEWTMSGEDETSVIFLDDEIIGNASDNTYTFTNLEPNTTYNVQVRHYCGDADTAHAASISVKTDCANGSCNIALNMGSSWNSPTIAIYQGSTELVATDYNANVDICNGDSVVVIYQSAPSYSYGSQNVSIIDVAGSELFSGDVSSYSEGDTIIALANGCPSCMPVNGLHVIDVDTVSITVEWTMNDEVEDYIVYLNGEEAGVVSSNSFSFSNLSPSTGYQVSVRANCGDEDTSAIRTLGVTTACGIILIDEETPYFEDFDAYTSEEAVPCWGGEEQYVIKGDGGLFFRAHSAGHAAVMPLTNQPINLLEATFYAKVGNGSDAADKIQIGVADAAGDNVEWLDTLYNPIQSRGDFTMFTYRFNNYEGNGRRIAFSNVNNINNWMLIDNLTVSLIAQCVKPDNVEPHNMQNADSTYFTWTSTSEDSQWQVVVGTSTDEIDDIASSATTVSEASYVIPAGTLTMGQPYSFYIRTLCADNSQSEWFRYDFTAGTVLMPTEGSDTVSGCGLVVYDNGGPYGGYVTSTTTTLVVRPSEVGAMIIIDSGWVHTYENGSTLTIYDGEGTDGDVLYTTTEALSIPGPIMGEDGSVTFRFSAGAYVATGFEVFTHCADAPTCIRPRNLGVSNIEATSATLAWTDANATDFNIYYRAEGETDWQSITANSVSDNTYTLPEGTLEPNTLYSIKVEGDCGGGDLSWQSTEVSFRTACEGGNCEFTVEAHDSGVDGWDGGAAIYVYQGGSQVDNLRLATGGQGTLNGSYCLGQSMELKWHSGSYDREISFTIFDADGNTVVSTSNASYLDDEMLLATFDEACVGTGEELPTGGEEGDCLAPTNLTVTGITATEATLNWTAGSEDDVLWEVQCGSIEEQVQTTTYQLTNLTPGQTYTVSVVTICDEYLNEVSAPTTTTFTTPEIEGIADVAQRGLGLHPNPATGVVTLDMQGMEEATVSVIDLNGREVMRTHAEGSSLTLDISRLQAGTYFVRVVSAHNAAVGKLTVK